MNEVVTDKLLNKNMLHGHTIKVVDTAPLTAKRGSLIFDLSDNSLKFFYYGWNTLANLN